MSSDDIVRRMELMDVPPGSYDEETLYDAVDEIKRLRAERDMLADALTAQVSPDLSAKTARLLFRNAIAELEARHGWEARRG